MKITDNLKKKILKIEKKRDFLNREYYSLRSILGYSWAIFYFLIGGREAGKSYAVTKFFINQWKKYGRPFYWLRLTKDSKDKLLVNNGEKLIDADIKRFYGLDIDVQGDNVYDVIKRGKDGKIKEKKLMARVLALSTFYGDKGSALFDKDFLNDPNMYYNICLDEMNREVGVEKNTFDILYAFTNQLENLVRSTKQRIRVICIGNLLEEASDILCAFNFLPEEFGRYKLKKKRAIVEYIEPTVKYLERRKGTIADILMPTASTFTNKIQTDETLVYKGRLTRANCIIKFRRDVSFSVWDRGVIAEYNGEHAPVIAMRPYLDENFRQDLRNQVFETFDGRAYLFKNLVTFKRFQKELALLRPKR